MTTDNRSNEPTEAQVEAAARKWIERLDSDAHWARSPGAREKASSEKKILEWLLEAAAADAVVTVDGLQERIEDTLAYYQCRETNPKADHPSMGYHAFSEEQREFLRARKSEAAAEIVRMILTLLRGGEDDDAVA